MTDTPPTTNPPSRLDVAKAFIGDLARPFAIIWISLATGIAIIRLATAEVDLSEAAVYIGAVLAGLGVLYGAKSLEESRKAKVAGDVAIAQTQAGVMNEQG
jgi:hypothetical protein